MNCKENDLVVVIKSGVDGNGPNLGKIVICKKYILYPFFNTLTFENDLYMPARYTEPILINILGGKVPVPDEQLRPIKPLGDSEEDIEGILIKELKYV